MERMTALIAGAGTGTQRPCGGGPPPSPRPACTTAPAPPRTQRESSPSVQCLHRPALASRFVAEAPVPSLLFRRPYVEAHFLAPPRLAPTSSFSWAPGIRAPVSAGAGNAGGRRGGTGGQGARSLQIHLPRGSAALRSSHHPPPRGSHTARGSGTAVLTPSRARWTPVSRRSGSRPIIGGYVSTLARLIGQDWAELAQSEWRFLPLATWEGCEVLEFPAGVSATSHVVMAAHSVILSRLRWPFPKMTSQVLSLYVQGSAHSLGPRLAPCLGPLS